MTLLDQKKMFFQVLLGDEVGEREDAGRDLDGVAAARATLLHQRVH